MPNFKVKFESGKHCEWESVPNPEFQSKDRASLWFRCKPKPGDPCEKAKQVCMIAEDAQSNKGIVTRIYKCDCDTPVEGHNEQQNYVELLNSEKCKWKETAPGSMEWECQGSGCGPGLACGTRRAYNTFDTDAQGNKVKRIQIFCDCAMP